MKDYKDMIETLKLKEFEKECIITLPEGFVYIRCYLECCNAVDLTWITSRKVGQLDK